MSRAKRAAGPKLALKERVERTLNRNDLTPFERLFLEQMLAGEFYGGVCERTPEKTRPAGEAEGDVESTRCPMTDDVEPAE